MKRKKLDQHKQRSQLCAFATYGQPDLTKLALAQYTYFEFALTITSEIEEVG